MTTAQFATDEQEIHQSAFALLQTIPGYTTYADTPMYKVLPAELPRLSIYIQRDHANVDGDFASDPHFVVVLTLVVSSIVELSDDNDNLAWLEQKSGEIKTLLMTNVPFQLLFEGVREYDRKLKFTQVGETMFGEHEIEMSIEYRKRWPPNVQDDLDLIHVESAYPPGSDPSQVQQIVREYDFVTQTQQRNHRHGTPNRGSHARKRHHTQTNQAPGKRRVFRE